MICIFKAIGYPYLFRNMCLEIYELDPVHFISVPKLAWQAALKKTKVKLDLLTNIDMLLMAQKGSRYFWIKGFIKSYHDEDDERYFLEVDIHYPANLYNVHNDFPFTPKKWKFKVKKLVANLQDKTEYAIHIINLKQVLAHGLVLNKVQRIIEFNQVELKSYINMNIDLRKKSKKIVLKNAF